MSMSMLNDDRDRRIDSTIQQFRESGFSRFGIHRDSEKMKALHTKQGAPYYPATNS